MSYITDRCCRSAYYAQQALNHVVGRGDDLGVRRIGLLGHDQLGEFVGDVGVRAFERRAADRAGRTGDRRARLIGHGKGPAVECLEVVGAVEMRQRDGGEIDVLTVGERSDHEPAIVDRDRLKLAGGVAVLGDGVDGRGAARAGKLRQGAGSEVHGQISERLTVHRHAGNGDGGA